MGPRTLVSSGNDAADELARLGALPAPSAIPLWSLPSISRIHFSLFSNWRGAVSSKFFDTQVPSVSTEELVLPRYARCVLSRLRCNGHSLLLGSYLTRIGRIENPSCSACGHSSHSALSSYGLLCHSVFVDSLVSLRPLGSCPASGAPCPVPRKGSGKQQDLGNYYFLNVSALCFKKLVFFRCTKLVLA